MNIVEALGTDARSRCCGCGACEAVCPRRCIAMRPDEAGFLHPAVDEAQCTHCGLCAGVCQAAGRGEVAPGACTGRQAGRGEVAPGACAEGQASVEQPCCEAAVPAASADRPASRGVCQAGAPKACAGQPRAYAAVSRDEAARAASSSGGVFAALAGTVLARGGAVFGAAFAPDFASVHHICIRSLDELHSIMGSKYVQSSTGDCYRQAAALLEEGVEVLYSGTPCQIEGLRRYLSSRNIPALRPSSCKGPDWSPALHTVEVVCHGVPSPAVWQDYVRNVLGPGLSSVNFRDKSTGWRNYSFAADYAARAEATDSAAHTVAPDSADHTDDPDSSASCRVEPRRLGGPNRLPGTCRLVVAHQINGQHQLSGPSRLVEPHRDNLYMQAFLGDVCLRPSCHDCPAKARSVADITLGDWWHLPPNLSVVGGTTASLSAEGTIAESCIAGGGIAERPFVRDDDKGVSLVIVRSDQGQKLLEAVSESLIIQETPYDAALKANPCITESSQRDSLAGRFWHLWRKGGLSAAAPLMRRLTPRRRRLRAKLISKLK